MESLLERIQVGIYLCLSIASKQVYSHFLLLLNHTPTILYLISRPTTQQKEEQVLSQDLAKRELTEILGHNIPKDVMDKIMAWKDKFGKPKPRTYR